MSCNVGWSPWFSDKTFDSVGFSVKDWCILQTASTSSDEVRRFGVFRKAGAHGPQLEIEDPTKTFRKLGALRSTPINRALMIRTPTKRTRIHFLETAKCFRPLQLRPKTQGFGIHAEDRPRPLNMIIFWSKFFYPMFNVPSQI